MGERWDAIVVSGGQNGLTCAADLARAGMKPLVLDKRSPVGGAAVTEKQWPGFKVSTLSYVQGLMPSGIIRGVVGRVHPVSGDAPMDRIGTQVGGAPQVVAPAAVVAGDLVFV